MKSRNLRIFPQVQSEISREPLDRFAFCFLCYTQKTFLDFGMETAFIIINPFNLEIELTPHNLCFVGIKSRLENK